jgi:peptidoglycan/xylan/chitin deacetylase (PgdA/CDA1 family)
MADGYLPIFSKAKTDEKIIAVTVDDFFQFTNARTIIDTAVDSGAKLTLFPIGKNVLREELQDTLVYAHECGMEIENHTFEHRPLYKMDDATMERQIYLQSLAVDYVLGVNYQEHFLRPGGGDGRDDQRTHLYIQQLGMYGIAHWTISGSKTSLKGLIKTLEPGNIYLFHTTDSDTEKLQEFIPAAIDAGYTLVTLNEMFGYPANEETPITTPIKDLVKPAPDPYVYEYKPLKGGEYLWDVYLLQQRLIELGWLEGKPDGEYGRSTFMAVGYFQLAAGIKADGKASPATQEALFKDDAPRSLDGKKPIGGKGIATPSATIDPNAPAATTAPRATQKPVEIDMSVFD